ncbi:MAG: acylneuraminate cytidylyltransferase [bacterium]|nr:acylneuraminate cytidylyltransferase [bacterium]
MATAVIQARMGSTRLPGKVLMEVNGVPLLKYQIDRVRKAETIADIIVATTTSEIDDFIVDFCDSNEIKCFRGSENDVLDRYYQCAKQYNLKNIVRLTADCPLSDPQVIDGVVNLFLQDKLDYAVNTVPVDTSTFPDGFDVEVFTMEALEKAHQKCSDTNYREHVTFYFWKDDNGFKTGQLINDKDYSKYRLTVDYPEDFEVVDYIFNELEKRRIFGHMDDVIEILEAAPEIKEKNSQYYFGIGWKK